MHIDCWVHSVPGPQGLTFFFSPDAPQTPASLGHGADPMGNSEWAQGPLRPQHILRAALGAAPAGAAGGVGHHRPPHTCGLGLAPELLSQEGPPGSPP